MEVNKIEIAEEIRSMVLTGQKVTAFVKDDSAGETPYVRGNAFVVADVKITSNLDPQEIQIVSEDGWFFLFDELEFDV